MLILRPITLFLLLSQLAGCGHAAIEATAASTQKMPIPPSKSGADNERLAALKRAADAILDSQTSDGAIVMGGATPRNARVVPYFSNVAAQGLIDAVRELHDSRHLRGAQKWVDWYDAHRNDDGTVCDYTGSPGNWKSTGDYDSTDSYAATYLSLVLAIYETRPNALWLKSRMPFIEKSMEAIRLTLQPNGLTIAKPKWPVMYVMDNVEVLLGLRAVAKLFALAGQTTQSGQTTLMADSCESSIQSALWISDKKYYRIGIQTDGGQMLGLEKWYPDIMASLMAVAWLPQNAARAKLYQSLKAKFSTQIPAAINSEDDLEHTVWWGLAAKNAGDGEALSRVKTQLNGYDTSVNSIYNVALPGQICHLLSNDPAPR